YPTLVRSRPVDRCAAPRHRPLRRVARRRHPRRRLGQLPVHGPHLRTRPLHHRGAGQERGPPHPQATHRIRRLLPQPPHGGAVMALIPTGTPPDHYWWDDDLDEEEEEVDDDNYDSSEIL